MWTILMRKEVILLAVIAFSHLGAYYYGTVRQANKHEKAIAAAVQKVQKEMNAEAVRQAMIARTFTTEQSKRLEDAGKTIRMLANDLKNFDTRLCPTVPDSIVQHLNTLRNQATPTRSAPGTMPSVSPTTPGHDLPRGSGTVGKG